MINIKKTNILPSAITIAVGVMLGIFIFFPWQTTAESAWYSAVGKASKHGVYISVDSIDTAGILSKEFLYKGVSADLPAARINISEIKVKPRILKSIIGGGKDMHIEFGNGVLIPVTRQTMEWQSGMADMSISKEEVNITDMNITGDVSVSGNASISMGNKPELTKAEIDIKVPRVLDRVLNLLRLSKKAPLTKTGEGEWRLTK